MYFPKPVILASNSPRRQQLLTDMGLSFTIRSNHTDESFSDVLPVREVPIMLAARKAETLHNEIEREVVITADTVVIIEDKILNKPADPQEAFQMLSLLSGNRHEVVTGVCLLSREKKVLFSDLTEVYFKTMTQEEIWYYIRYYAPFDKAGAYGAQEWMGMVGIEKIVGSYFNIMGLPVHKLYEEMKEFM